MRVRQEDLVVRGVVHHAVTCYLSVSHGWLLIPGQLLVDVTGLQQPEILIGRSELDQILLHL